MVKLKSYFIEGVQDITEYPDFERPTYLLQGAKFEVNTSKSGLDQFIKLEYMGAAEYEFGAVGKCLDKMRSYQTLSIRAYPLLNADKLVHDYDGTMTKMTLRNRISEGVLYIITDTDHADEALKDARLIIDNKTRLKSVTALMSLTEVSRESDVWISLTNKWIATFNLHKAELLLSALVKSPEAKTTTTDDYKIGDVVSYFHYHKVVQGKVAGVSTSSDKLVIKTDTNTPRSVSPNQVLVNHGYKPANTAVPFLTLA